MSSIVIDSPIGFIEITGTAAVISSVIFFHEAPHPNSRQNTATFIQSCESVSGIFCWVKKKI